MALAAFLDTCTLFGEYLCDTLLRLAEEESYRPLWSAGVLEELERNVVQRHRTSEEAIRRRISQMQRAFPDAEVREYESLIDVMTCDPKDKHVLAAAVRGQAEVLITSNIDDFPDTALAPYDITAIHPDDFLLDQLDLYPGVTIGALRAQADSYVSPPMSIDELLGRLAAAGVPKFAAEVTRYL